MSTPRPAPTTADRPAPRSASSGGSRRRRAKRGEGDQLRDEILDAAHELLLETGSADKVSTRAVAQRVGCSSPALYLHFPDKASLLFSVCERRFQHLGELVAAAAATTEDPVAGLRAAAQAYVDFALANPEEYRVMTMAPPGFVWAPEPEELAREAGFEVMLDLLDRATAAGAVHVEDPFAVGLAIWSTLHGLVALRIAKPDFAWPPVDESVDRAFRLLIDGLAPRDGGGPAASGGTRGRRRGSGASTGRRRP